ncbi:MAG: filamentous hemagglutinin N-terminal domain-containing protein, partial [Candidatus Omnitrophota bacterium]|nr:filamentous hemagglutinin N-terminal domain-containing protein [Candidatus Omnitrophota bacterium]MBU1928824.1 filamentous hemagglutinin N-terminal domain-containing protein [Candidatus Omnitrophota bacterium]MBU2035337.1 filamentous hemagglutinin N-terminal domain-containing protein [Candidatus Omnitrophota bacterium]MBU2258339.1 filamentous hemagglutinin N-terminal domain-containing protein [Candidatus Omnitrophota bacterium]
MGTPRFILIKFLANILFAILLIIHISAYPLLALPEGENVVYGQAQFSLENPSTLNIRTSDKVIINYNGFGIGASETVNFLQPSSSSVALNRVTGGSISEIYGSLNANGNIFLINPNGILFGKDCSVNVGGLVASTLNMVNEDFIINRYNLFKDTVNGFIDNKGIIETNGGGSVSLIAGAVKNEGTISARLGSVNLVSGEAATLELDNRGLIQAVITEKVKTDILDKDNNKVNDAVSNTGSILAEGGLVKICSEAITGIFDNLVNQEGTIKATSLIEKDGQVILTSESQGIIQNTGQIDVSADQDNLNGGNVLIQGEMVGQFGEIKADALNGNAGDIKLLAKNIVSLNGNSVTTADAKLNGRGGNINIYSEDTAIIKTGAKISAQGGEFSGDGGFIETSGLKVFDINVAPNVGAKNGRPGTWLIDPNNIIIQDNGAAHANMDTVGSPWYTTADSAIVDVGLLQTALQGGNVELETRTAAPNAENGDITLAAVGINFNGVTGATLTLDAAGNIIINGGISDGTPGGGDTLNLIFIAGGNVDINAAIDTAGGSLTSSGIAFDNTLGTITTTGGNVDLTGHTGAIIIGATTNTGSGAFSSAGTTFDNTGGTITTTDNAITLTQTGAITFGANLDAGSGALTATAGNNAITFTANSVTSGDLSLTGSTLTNLDLATLTTTGALTAKPSDTTSTIGLGDGSTGTFNLVNSEIAKIKGTAATSVTIGATGGTGALDLGADVDLAGKTVAIKSGQINNNVQTINADTLSLTINSGGSANIIKTNVATLNADTTAGSDATGRSITVTESDVVDLGTVNLGTGTLTLAAGGAITQSGALTAGTLSLTNTAGSTTLNNVGNSISALGTIDATG